jgi:hypothetical protein
VIIVTDICVKRMLEWVEGYIAKYAGSKTSLLDGG